MSVNIAAVDLGASSGRVIWARYDPVTQDIAMQEMHRFANGMVQIDGQDCWEPERLFSNILHGLEKIDAAGVRLDAVGIDAWGVDFVLLDAAGKMLGEAVAYRDDRTDGVPERLWQQLPREAIYRRSGIQFLKFNSLYQIRALLDEQPAWLAQAARLLLIPDYLHYRLSGELSCEFTNASTSQLVNARSRDWDPELLALIGEGANWLQPITAPGTRLGHWTSPSGHQVSVILPATHDTGSAIVATPLAGSGAAYISSGTWSLVGVERQAPITDEAAEAANLTNEGGVEGTWRLLKNVMGLWLVQRLQALWPSQSFATLVAQAEQVRPFAYLIHPNDERFLNPPCMRTAIQQFCQVTGQGKPQTAGELVRCVLDSLALCYDRVLGELEAVTGEPITTLHIVGGGSQNQLLNRLCADICQRTVLTGPVEASALGNIGWQLKGLGLLQDLADVRRLIRHNTRIETLEPREIPQLDRHRKHFAALCAHSHSDTLIEEVV
ncbi:rhamnulokinase [Aeromonas sp. sif2416]|uniref:rhamnulokinase n=1 Tax=Aeromonas sp. sif2416 TaxID=2854793 RepID=UPI001C493DB3|nr:rhamnulokinase [Aeromonas sp. sif2416]MBV7438245.1 rhamnulokinase [Aeromonas sp. sif2416]